MSSSTHENIMDGHHTPSHIAAGSCHDRLPANIDSGDRLRILTGFTTNEKTTIAIKLLYTPPQSNSTIEKTIMPAVPAAQLVQGYAANGIAVLEPGQQPSEIRIIEYNLFFQGASIESIKVSGTIKTQWIIGDLPIDIDEPVKED